MSERDSLERTIGELLAEQRIIRTQVDRLNGLQALAPAIETLTDTAKVYSRQSEEINRSMVRLETTMTSVQGQIVSIQDNQEKAEVARQALASRQYALEMKQASAFARSLPLIISALAALAATGSAVASLW